MKKPFTILIYFLLLQSINYGQEDFQLFGTIVSESNEPLPNANIRVIELDIGTASDEYGNYKISFTLNYDTEEDVQIKVSFIGFKTQIVKVPLAQKSIEINFTLIEDIFESETVVVTGIASKTSKSIAEVAVSRLDVSELTEKSSYQTMSQMVSGKLAGVQMKPTSGNVGGGFRFFMRSGGGINGNEQPVIYVDGVRVNDDEIPGMEYPPGQGMSILSNLNPEDIESIDVLKGPAGAAMYGTSGSNGAVLIKTKTGYYTSDKDGDFRLNYKYEYGNNTQSYEYDEDDFLTANDANQIFRDGIIRHHNLNAAGGINLLKYFVSFDNRFENGIINNNSMDRTSMRLNLEVFPSEKLNFRLKVGYTENEIQRPTNDRDSWGILYNTLLFSEPYTETDSIAIIDVKENNNSNQFIGSANINFVPFENMEANLTIGLDASDWRRDYLAPSTHNYNWIESGLKSIDQRTNNQVTYDFNLRYRYYILNDLNITSIIGSQLFERKEVIDWSTSERFLTDLITAIDGGSYHFTTEDASHLRSVGIFTEHSMNYSNQYFLTLGLRNDFASSIGERSPNIFYPKASFAIRLDKYDTFPKVFDLMKIRFAYGESGVLPNPLDPIPLLWGTALFGAYGSGAYLKQVGNDKIEPERIKEYEIGFDAELFRNYSLEFSFYEQFASNSIFNVYNSPSTGKTATPVPFNVGALESWGVETLLRATPIRENDYRLDLSLIYNYQKNEVTDLGGSDPIVSNINVIKEGLPKHEFYTQKVLGAKFNEDGTYNEPEVTEENVSLGNPIPDHTGSFSLNFSFLRNFNFYVLADWALNNKIYNRTKRIQTWFGNNLKYNELKDKLGIWGEEYDDLTPGTAEYIDAANQYAKLDWTYRGNFVEDADYFKIREISISYNLKETLELLNFNTQIRDLVVGVSARNIWTTTKYRGADVEVNSRGSRSLIRGQDYCTLQNPKVYYFWVRVGI